MPAVGTPAERLASWIEEQATKTPPGKKSWSDRLGEWLGRFIGSGLTGALDILGTKFKKPLKPLIDKLVSTGKVPPELQEFLNELLEPSGEIAGLIGTSASNALVSGSIGKIIDASLLPLAYAINSFTKNVIPNPDQMIEVFLRSPLGKETLYKAMAQHGLDKDVVDYYLLLREARFAPEAVQRLWLRDKTKYEGFWKDIKEAGWTDDRIDAIKTLAELIPGVQDLIRFAVKEAFTPEIAERFGQYQDFPEAVVEWGEKQGLSREWLTRYWAAHWDLPSVSQAFEMFHREVITKDELPLLLRALDIMPYWRDKLTQIAYNPYTRVDARRMWDLGVLDDKELKRSYLDIGYDDKHADTMVLWTKIFQTFPDLIARYKNGYINLEQVKSELLALGMNDDRANFLIETKIKIAQPDRVAKERDLTKAEIIKGLKKGVIQRTEATEFLYDMGYDEDEAKFILAINVPEEETTPALTRKELTKSDILSAVKKGLITPEDALARLIKLRYTSDDATFLVDLALATATTVTEPKQKELTKADITKGVKLGVITAEEGYLMLQDIGYEAWEAAYILTISAPAPTGSPDSYSEFKKLTQSWRASQGLPTKEIATELIEAERDLIASRKAFDFGKKRGLPEEKQAPLSKAVSDAQYRYRQLLAKYKLPG
jgi:hypothetical protein